MKTVPLPSRSSCYGMEVGENCVRVFYGTEMREEKDSRYIQEALVLQQHRVSDL
jgi:hypothetical protein